MHDVLLLPWAAYASTSYMSRTRTAHLSGQVTYARNIRTKPNIIKIEVHPGIRGGLPPTHVTVYMYVFQGKYAYRMHIQTL